MVHRHKSFDSTKTTVESYQEHYVFVPNNLSGIHSRLDYVDIRHIQDFTELYYGATLDLPDTARYAEQRAYRLFGKLILPQTIFGKAVNRFDHTKVAAAYDLYGLDIQPSHKEDIATINPIDAVLGVDGLIKFVNQTRLRPSILERYTLNAPPTYPGPNGDLSPDHNILVEFSSHLERITSDEGNTG